MNDPTWRGKGGADSSSVYRGGDDAAAAASSSASASDAAARLKANNKLVWRKFLVTASLILLLPGVTYLVLYQLLTRTFDVSSGDATVYGGIAAIVEVNALVALYTVIAFRESSSDGSGGVGFGTGATAAGKRQ